MKADIYIAGFVFIPPQLVKTNPLSLFPPSTSVALTGSYKFHFKIFLPSLAELCDLLNQITEPLQMKDVTMYTFSIRVPAMGRVGRGRVKSFLQSF